MFKTDYIIYCERGLFPYQGTFSLNDFPRCHVSSLISPGVIFARKAFPIPHVQWTNMICKEVW